LLQLLPGILLLANRFVPLALTLLGPIVVGLLAARIASEMRSRGTDGAAPPDVVMLVRNAQGGYEEEEPC